jgi:hypothetical protein
MTVYGLLEGVKYRATPINFTSVEMNLKKETLNIQWGGVVALHPRHNNINFPQFQHFCVLF